MGGSPGVGDADGGGQTVEGVPGSRGVVAASPEVLEIENSLISCRRRARDQLGSYGGREEVRWLWSYAGEVGKSWVWFQVEEEGALYRATGEAARHGRSSGAASLQWGYGLGESVGG